MLSAVLSLATTTALTADITPDERRSGYDFAGPDIRAMQDDDTANPGILWVFLQRIPARSLPKPPLSPVPPDLSGSDQARFTQHVKEPWAAPDETDNSAIIGHAHAITPEWRPTNLSKFLRKHQ